MAPSDFAVGAVLSHIGYLEALKILHPLALHKDAVQVEPRETAKKLAAALLKSRRDFSARTGLKTQSAGGGLLNFTAQGPQQALRNDERIVGNGRPCEEHDTSAMTALLHRITAQAGLEHVVWLHQAHDSLNHKLDITGAIVVESSKGMDFEPFVVIEVGDEDKCAQLFTYVYNVYVSDEQFGERNRLALGLELQLSKTGFFEKIVLHGYRQAYCKKESDQVTRLPRVLLTDVELANFSLSDGDKAQVDVLERIFECVLQCAETNGWEGNGSPCRVPITGTVVSRLAVRAPEPAVVAHVAGASAPAPAPAPAADGAVAPATALAPTAGTAVAAAAAAANTNDAPPNPQPNTSLRVFKAFSRTSARRLEPSLNFLGAQIELQDVPIGKKIVSIISYPYIEGSHTAENVAQLVAIARCVLNMHTAGWCHSDVREANMVFTRPAATSCLIDFDFAHNITESSGSDARYPRNWNTTIDDGARHPGATAGAEVRFEHDVFALHAVMRLYQPVCMSGTTATFSWDRWIALLCPTPSEGGQPSHTTTLLQAFISAADSGQNMETLLLRRKDHPSTPAASAAQADFGADHTGTPP